VVKPVFVTVEPARTPKLDAAPIVTVTGPAPTPLSRIPRGFLSSQHPAVTSASTDASINKLPLPFRIMVPPKMPLRDKSRFCGANDLNQLHN
jgi:hypothetical protein